MDSCNSSDLWTIVIANKDVLCTIVLGKWEEVDFKYYILAERSPIG